MVKRWFPWVLVTLFGLAACGSAPKHEAQQAASEPTQVAETREAPARENVPVPAARPSESKPKVEATAAPSSSLSADLLYELIVAEVAIQRGQLDFALERYVPIVEQYRSARLAERVMRIALYLKRPLIAYDVAELWVSIAPDDLEARKSAARLSLHQQKLDRSVEHLQAIIERLPNIPLGLNQVALILSKEKNRPSSIQVMNRIAEQYQDKKEAWYAMALVALSGNDLNLASQSIDKALEIDAQWRNALVLRSRILVRQGNNSEALAALKKLAESNPDDLNTRLIYLGLMIENEETDKALVELKSLSKHPRNNPSSLYSLSQMSLQLNETAIAKEALLKVIKARRHVQESAYYLGQIAENDGDYEEAIRWFSQVTEGEFELSAQVRAAVLMAEVGDVVDARRHLTRLRRQQPELAPRLYLIEGEILVNKEMLTEALGLYDEALSETPEDVGLLYARGLLGESLGKLDIMERDLSQIIRQDPRNANALNALGYTLANRTDRLEEALGYIKQALELKPNNPAVKDSMGWVQYRLGNYAEAERYLREAHNDLADSEIAAHLGEVLLVQGNLEEARSVLKKALEADPESPLLLKVWRKLD